MRPSRSGRLNPEGKHNSEPEETDPREIQMADITNESPERSIDTLSAFVKDAEHDILSVITALQAHIDLLHEEQVRNHMSVDRFAILNRSIARIVTDATSLSSVSELAHAPRSKERVILDVLMQEIAAETRSAFSKSQV